MGRALTLSTASAGRQSHRRHFDNARTMDFHAKDVGYVPRVAPHYIENTGDVDLVFLEIFAAPELLDISLHQWNATSPKLMVQEHLGLSAEEIDSIPREKELVLR